jgi:phosphodiesterase/alkaline phosphatase D-like protein
MQAERDGSNEYNAYQPGALNTTDRLVEDIDNIDLVIHNGDIVYANGYLSEWDKFTEQVENITSRVPYMISRYNNTCP